jgi:uncharacterized protein (DUF488 family)
MRFYTLGYQGIYLETFIEALRSQNIGTLLDVRAVPWSRREEFSKRDLAGSLEKAGVNYIHLERAGNPAVRAAREDGDVYTDYYEYIQKNPNVLDEVFAQIKVSHETNGPACLMCKEADPSHCHRSALTKLLVEKYPELEPLHLMIGAHRDTESGFLPFMESGVIRVLSNGQPLRVV